MSHENNEFEVEHEDGFSGLPSDQDRSQMVIVDWSLWSTVSMGRTILSLDNLLSEDRQAAINHLELIRHSIELPHHHHLMAHTDLRFGALPEGGFEYSFTAPAVERPYEEVLFDDRYLVSRFPQLPADADIDTIPMGKVTISAPDAVDPGTVLRMPKSQINENSRLQLSEIEKIIADYYALTAEDGRLRLHPIVEIFLTMVTHWTADTEFYVSSVQRTPEENIVVQIYHNATPAAIRFEMNLPGLGQANSVMLSTIS